MHSVFVRSEYLSGNFSLHPPHTERPNTSSQTQSISMPPHSRHFLRLDGSSSTLMPGSNLPALLRSRLRSTCSLSHSCAVMCCGRTPAPSSPPAPGRAANMLPSSSADRKPPFVSVMALMS